MSRPWKEAEARRRKAWKVVVVVMSGLLMGFVLWSCDRMTERQEAEARVWSGSKIVRICARSTAIWHRPTDNSYWVNKRWPAVGPEACEKKERND